MKKLTKMQIAEICFGILGRYFPGASGTDTPELRKTLGVPEAISGTPDLDSRTSDASAWKAGACKWLSKHITLK